MEKRFGIKDLMLFLLLGALVLVVLLAMKQYDRQWQVLDEIRKQGAEQTQQLAAIRRAVQSGAYAGPRVATTGPAGGAAATAAAIENDPFKYVREAEQM